MIEAATEGWVDARARWARFTVWRRELTDELVQLPDTMQRLREGAANFQTVGERLAKSSASLERISDIYESTIAESGKRSAQAIDVLKSQVEALAGGPATPESLSSSMDEMQRAFESIAELNPFWPKSTRKR